jgi:hypothetical protein
VEKEISPAKQFQAVFYAKDLKLIPKASCSESTDKEVLLSLTW